MIVILFLCVPVCERVCFCDARNKWCGTHSVENRWRDCDCAFPWNEGEKLENWIKFFTTRGWMVLEGSKFVAFVSRCINRTALRHYSQNGTSTSCIAKNTYQPPSPAPPPSALKKFFISDLFDGMQMALSVYVRVNVRWVLWTRFEFKTSKSSM